jgi:hypothetical protein
MDCDPSLMEKQSLLLTSVQGTPKTTSVFLQYVQEAASGATPHCYDALKLTFGNTVDAIKQERQKIADKRKAREAEIAREAQIAREAEMSRPMLKCTLNNTRCSQVSIANLARSIRKCPSWYCSGGLMCSACSWIWGGGENCHGCGKAFR